MKSWITRLDDILGLMKFNPRRARKLRSREEAEQMTCSRPASPWDEPRLQLTCVPALSLTHHREKRHTVLHARSRIPSCRQRHRTPSTYCTLLWELIAQFGIKRNGSRGWSGPSEGSAKWGPELLCMIIRSGPWRSKTNTLKTFLQSQFWAMVWLLDKSHQEIEMSGEEGRSKGTL